MTDLIEYLVSEFKNKRLSKADASSLINELHSKSEKQSAVAQIHPLLHRNTSDLGRQCYTTKFNGDEFFLRDHVIGEHKILPGVAYLEMIRAAVEHSMPTQLLTQQLNFQDIVWIQPVVVKEPVEVTVEVFSDDSAEKLQRIDFNVYSKKDGSDQRGKVTLHCQGHVIVTEKPDPARIDLLELKSQMTDGSLDSAQIYPAYANTGIFYGPSHQGVQRIERGDGQLLASLNIPEDFLHTLDDYQLHPGIMDAALQCPIGFIENLDEIGTRPRLPFAIESLRVLSSCTAQMHAWLRYSAGSQPDDRVSKLDIDLCDSQGNICVQMRGVTSRELVEDAADVGVIEDGGPELGSIYAAPQWVLSNSESPELLESSAYDQQHVIICGYEIDKAEAVAALQKNHHHLLLPTEPDKSSAQMYTEVALSCFELIHRIFNEKSSDSIMLQILAPNRPENFPLVGLSGLLKTANIENPRFHGQIILAESNSTTEQLLEHLEIEKLSPLDQCVKFENSSRFVRELCEFEPVAELTNTTYRENGVYLITGGLGQLGTLFAKDILNQSPNATVLLTGRSKLSDDKRAILKQISSDTAVVEYHTLDLDDLGQTRRLIDKVNKKYGGLSGVIHCAGMIADGFILNKTSAEFSQVLAPKVAGTANLDEATKDINLDFMLLFSSAVSEMGNIGQADYAAANGFIDQFARYRTQQQTQGQRSGTTVAINWPLWEAGGMHVDAAALTLLKQVVGMYPITSATGVQVLQTCLQMQQPQVLYIEGDLVKLRDALFHTKAASPLIEHVGQSDKPVPDGHIVDSDSLRKPAVDFLTKQLASYLKLPPHELDLQAPFEKYGINSIMMTELTNELEKSFGSLPKTLFFEHQSASELIDYFLGSHSERLQHLVGNIADNQQQATQPIRRQPQLASQPAPALPGRRSRRNRTVIDSTDTQLQPLASEPIAIIGLSGRYPQAFNVTEYWDNLQAGKDSIVEVPKSRWDWREFYSDDRSQEGRHFSKWGGFIDGVDEFDPLFFNISPLEAPYMEPQERLFLQHAWMALEDAGYKRSSLQIAHDSDLAAQVGVYVGVMYSEYQLFGAEALAKGKTIGVPGSYASIANRISYLLNLHGPSMSIDTMCSSSLTAIHLACQDLKLGRTDLAIAGGVNISIHPSKYLVISSGQFISSDGHCQSFGVGGDGYIPGEGVGAVLLKRLSEAERDGDHIYGMIKGSAINHGGKTNGYSVPNLKAQAAVISRALTDAKVDPRHISYVEAHGTGTKLGDPIEIAALTQVFSQHTQDTGFCLIGSAKSNIGHCESAAGIAGLTKVLLQMKQRKIVPSLHSEVLNPNIDFEKTPFIVNQTLTDWEQPIINQKQQPRIAGLSSFGAGGSNAHFILQEYSPSAKIEQSRLAQSSNSGVMLILSARTDDQLKQKARDLVKFIQLDQELSQQKVASIDLVSMAYTLQVGREEMDQRLGVMATSVEQLCKTLESYLDDQPGVGNLVRGSVNDQRDPLSQLGMDDDFQSTIDQWIVNGKLTKLLELWVNGLSFDWNRLYSEIKPTRMSLPTYPFAKQRYWVDSLDGGTLPSKDYNARGLHPLLQHNTSDLTQQRYRSTFSGDEFFLADHQVALGNDEARMKVLPGVVYLEMARAAMANAVPAQQQSGVLTLTHTAWIQPLVVTDAKAVDIMLSTHDDGGIGFDIVSHDNDQVITHSQGRGSFSDQVEPSKVDIEELLTQMRRERLDAEELYQAYTGMGIYYGPSFQAVTSVYRGEKQLLAYLRLPASLEATQSDYLLHPSMVDSALQAALGLVDDLAAQGGRAPLPFALDELIIVSECKPTMVAWVRYSADSETELGVTKLDIDLCDEAGNICIQLTGFTSRTLSPNQGVEPATETSLLLATPIWQQDTERLRATSPNANFVETHFVLCDLNQINIDQFKKSVSADHCLSLRSSGVDGASRFGEIALGCFEYLQDLLKQKPTGKTHLQIVVAATQPESLLAGLSGLLKTATLENPLVSGQIVLIDPAATAAELSEQLLESQGKPQNAIVRYESGARHVSTWQEVATQDSESVPTTFKDRGVYLITGGIGALGVLFANEIFKQTDGAKVVLAGRSELAGEKKQKLADLSVDVADQLFYQHADISDSQQTKQLIDSIVAEHGQLDGVIHSAGIVSDNFILKKNAEEFEQVMQPKVAGTYNLDVATKDLQLDFMVLFSSTSGAMGNLGQADYAAANGFMDQFSAQRNDMVESGKRHGRTVSINWPLWQEGGMGVDQATLGLLRQAAGIVPLETPLGLQAFYRSLGSGLSQVMVMQGDLAKMRSVVFYQPKSEQPAISVEVGARDAGLLADTVADSGSVVEQQVEQSQKFLIGEISSVLKLPAHEIDPKHALENYGIDSISAMKLTNRLEESFGSLSKTLFFEYQTIAALAVYFARNHQSFFDAKPNSSSRPLAAKRVDSTRQKTLPVAVSSRANGRYLHVAQQSNTDIAIIGMAGRYPQADTLEQFWGNLKAGKDCIEEVPAERWDHDLYFDVKRNQVGKTYSKWGGFINDVDKFDPLFFNISPKEAELIDPQERLFIETAWHTIEDAGYTKDSISAQKVGVYVGVMWSQYQLLGSDANIDNHALVSSSSFGSIANRVSYFFNLQGPSIALDTMCSSSLTAIHLACEDLRKGEVDAAIAGGVNVSVHPNKYINLSQGNFVASDGRCRSFGDGGDGYVPGEGVGAVLLKPLDKALNDGDEVYAVIKSTNINHGGKTNGYSVPNPVAQKGLIIDSLKKAGIQPDSLSYIETHGTGTSLGDPIEFTGLQQAFEESSEGDSMALQSCPIGSVKSNIGHLESAAAIAAVSKVLLQLKHKQLVPSLHASPLNPNINFDESPFFVQTELADWTSSSKHPRRASVSSFGAGGSNGHLILEEFIDARAAHNEYQQDQPEVFVLSARDTGSLYRYAESTVRFLDREPTVPLLDLAYTSQIGRTGMNQRLALIVTSVEELKDKLTQWIAENSPTESGPATPASTGSDDVYFGNTRDAGSGAKSLVDGEAGRALFEVVLENRDLQKIANLWIAGVDIEWPRLYPDSRPRKVLSLPSYPFARDRYWITGSAQPLLAKRDNGTRSVVLDHQPNEEKRRIFYRPKWIAEPVAESTVSALSQDNITVVLDVDDALFNKLKDKHPDQFERGGLILVQPSDSFNQIEPSRIAIDSMNESHFDRLLEVLSERLRLPITIIHHCSTFEQLEAREQVEAHLNASLYPLFNLSKALIKRKYDGTLRILSLCSTSADRTVPQSAALGGFYKTLTLENPRFKGKIVEVLGDANSSLDDRIKLIDQELDDTDWQHNVVRYRCNADAAVATRYKQVLAPVADLNTPTELPVRQQGVYVISGGLGGLGYFFSEYLARSAQAKLVLFGRSQVNKEQQDKIDNLESLGAEVLYIQADASSSDDMNAVIATAKSQFSRVDGVIHSAGVNKDSFILKKSIAEVEAVIEPKIYGAIHLDNATRQENLDFFVLFSSVAGVMGNIGQSDYAYGNHFLDSFAEYRQSLTRERMRCGQTLSINWPYWRDGGMSLEQNDIDQIEALTGISPLPTLQGIQCFEEALATGFVQGVALYGDVSKIRGYVEHKPVTTIQSQSAGLDTMDSGELVNKTQSYLQDLIGQEIKLQPDRVDVAERFEAFGIDSVAISKINTTLERDVGALPKTLFYEYETIAELTGYLTQQARPALIALFNMSALEVRELDNVSPEPNQAKPYSFAAPVQSERIASSVGEARAEYTESEPIAIIGVHGLYPKSKDLYEYWDNLSAGKDLIDLVPQDRWDYNEYYDADPSKAVEGKIYCKWGGFIDDHDKFDPNFFSISAAEAQIIDPQERLFLQSVWSAFEDAGYTRETLKQRHPKGKSANVGVYVGVTTNTYHLLGPEESLKGNVVTPSSLPWSIANRVSYFFDFQGPSLPVDTACSSGLVALDLACESLKSGGCQVAVAGGVNLYLHPSKYQSFCQRGMIALDGKTRSYGDGNGGFVPSEAVASLILKPLSQAVKDRDPIRGVIRGTAFSHSGRSNGYSAPNPNSQADLIGEVLSESGVDPRTISYVEGHGTGTQLGDSLEVAALSKAFRTHTPETQFCSIGSVKGNIGHPEAVAGIAGITKVLLQFKHSKIAPSIHSDQVNPDIDFEGTPFQINRKLVDWESTTTHPKRALVNAFGSGGVNACAVIEEYTAHQEPDNAEAAGSYLFTLSAQNESRLREHVSSWLVFLDREKNLNLANAAYTLQVGRESMREKLAIVVSDREGLIESLKHWSTNTHSEQVYCGVSNTKSRGEKHQVEEGDLGQDATEKQSFLRELAQLWVAGTAIEWHGLYPIKSPVRVPVPTYSFAKERYWLSDRQVTSHTESQRKPITEKLHPLVARNSSTLREISFSSLLSSQEFYARDHAVNGQKMFPGSGFLEMACISGAIAGENKVSKIQDIVWVAPLTFTSASSSVQISLNPAQSSTGYVITSLNDSYQKVVHSEGKLIFKGSDEQKFDDRNSAADQSMAISDLVENCTIVRSGSDYYKLTKKAGFDYGETFQTIQEFYINESYAVSKLVAPAQLADGFDQFILHPSMIDGALQTVSALMGGVESSTPYIPFAIDEIEIIRPLTKTCFAYVEFAEAEGRGNSELKKFNINVVSPNGDVLVAIKNFYVRALIDNTRQIDADSTRATN